MQPGDCLDGVTTETRKCCGFLFFGLQSQSELFFIVMIGNICANEDDCDNDDGDNDDGDNDADDNDDGDNDDGDNDDGDNYDGENDDGNNDLADNDDGDDGHLATSTTG